ncbi:ubiquinone/menaquinone biosynthesis methyltransferase [Chloroflexota bacterium]
MNRLMTFGQDIRWRRDLIRRADLAPREHLLDLGSGTGDLAREALRQQPQCLVVAADYTLGMMQVGRTCNRLDLSAADAQHLPFPVDHFDAVVSAFLMRNVLDVPLALGEQYRTLKPGGRILILDTTRPERSLLYPLVWLYLHMVIPILGGLVTGQRDAYSYLPESTAKFLYAEQLADAMRQAGFSEVGFRRRMFGTIATHWGIK